MKRIMLIFGVTLCLGCTALAVPVSYVANLDGPSEPTISPGTGTAFVTLDTTAHTLFVSVTFSGLLAGTTASHIHCCTAAPFTGTAGVATQVPTFSGFPLGVTSGNYPGTTFDTSLAGSWNPAFITANGGTPATAEAVLSTGLAAGKAYLNIHSSQFPGGEIRGFLVTPEPGTLALGVFGLAGLLTWRRKSHNS